MAENLDVLNTAVSLLIRAVLLAGRFLGRVRSRSLKRLAARDVDTNAREILFLKDRPLQYRTSCLRRNPAHDLSSQGRGAVSSYVVSAL